MSMSELRQKAHNVSDSKLACHCGNHHDHHTSYKFHNQLMSFESNTSCVPAKISACVDVNKVPPYFQVHKFQHFEVQDCSMEQCTRFFIFNLPPNPVFHVVAGNQASQIRRQAAALASCMDLCTRQCTSSLLDNQATVHHFWVLSNSFSFGPNSKPLDDAHCASYDTAVRRLGPSGAKVDLFAVADDVDTNPHPRPEQQQQRQQQRTGWWQKCT